jgi:hypothetical protein
VNSWSTGGSPSEPSFGISCGISRKAAESAARCMYAFTRKRAFPGIE